MSYIVTGGAMIVESSLTRSWGISPASASVTAVGNVSVNVGNDFSLNLGGSTFYGVVAQKKQVTTFQGGKAWQLALVDNRIKLMWDDVYCGFNNEEIREDNPATPGVDRQKRYWHVMPQDWDSQTKTWTKQPYSAQQIIGFLFQADTLSYRWSPRFHNAQQKPVYGVDAMLGKKLGNVLLEISEEQGLVFTLVGQNQIQWARKGEGSIPGVPANASSWSSGQSLNTNDTQVRLVGDRSLYQDALKLEPSWVSYFERFWSEPDWLAEVNARMGPFGADTEGRALLAIKARSVTLREYVTATGNTALSDYALWGEVSRMEIPVWTYLQDIVFKAYRVPLSYKVNGIPLSSLQMSEGLLGAVTYTTDGAISLKSPREYYPDTKAFCLVQGQQIGLLDPRTQGLITSAQLANARNLWAPCNRFNLDVKNNGLILEEAAIIPGSGTAGLFIFPNQSVSSVASTDQLHRIAVPNAQVQISAAAVRASITWEAERFSKRYGSGVRKGPKYVRGLCYHAFLNAGVFGEEVKYASGKTTDQVAAEFGAQLIAVQATYADGEQRREGTAGTELNGVIDRVTVTLSFNEGLVETLGLTKELGQSNFESERELDRRSKSRDLFPGQKSLEKEVENLRTLAVLARSLKRAQEPRYRDIAQIQQKPVGAIDCSTTTFDSTDSWNAGQPVFTDATGAPASDGKNFLGVVISHQATGKGITVANSGVVPVRVKGPFKAGDGIGIDTGVGQIAKKGGALSIGTAGVAYEGSDTIVALVSLGGGAKSQQDFELYAADAAKVGIRFGNITPAIARAAGVNPWPKDFKAPDWTYTFSPESSGVAWLVITVNPGSSASGSSDGGGSSGGGAGSGSGDGGAGSPPADDGTDDGTGAGGDEGDSGAGGGDTPAGGDDGGTYTPPDSGGGFTGGGGDSGGAGASGGW